MTFLSVHCHASPARDGGFQQRTANEETESMPSLRWSTRSRPIPVMSFRLYWRLYFADHRNEIERRVKSMPYLSDMSVRFRRMMANSQSSRMAGRRQPSTGLVRRVSSSDQTWAVWHSSRCTAAIVMTKVPSLNVTASEPLSRTADRRRRQWSW